MTNEPLFDSVHTHLDQRRRPPGQCAACDIRWQTQAAIITYHEQRCSEHVDARIRVRQQHLWELGDHRYRRSR
jgi:hypothetical protein